MTGLTKDSLKVDICSKCHPFYTGEMKFVDTLGRVERFQRKQAAMAGKVVIKKSVKKFLKKQKEMETEAAKPKSLREMVERVKKEQKKEEPA